ncbi:MAG: hypothetical protein ACI86H_002553 [bacterium]|jgi:hypothetical protein
MLLECLYYKEQVKVCPQGNLTGEQLFCLKTHLERCGTCSDFLEEKRKIINNCGRLTYKAS